MGDMCHCVCVPHVQDVPVAEPEYFPQELLAHEFGEFLQNEVIEGESRPNDENGDENGEGNRDRNNERRNPFHERKNEEEENLDDRSGKDEKNEKEENTKSELRNRANARLEEIPVDDLPPRENMDTVDQALLEVRTRYRQHHMERQRAFRNAPKKDNKIVTWLISLLILCILLALAHKYLLYPVDIVPK